MQTLRHSKILVHSPCNNGIITNVKTHVVILKNDVSYLNDYNVKITCKTKTASYIMLCEQLCTPFTSYRDYMKTSFIFFYKELVQSLLRKFIAVSFRKRPQEYSHCSIFLFAFHSIVTMRGQKNLYKRLQLERERLGGHEVWHSTLPLVGCTSS